MRARHAYRIGPRHDWEQARVISLRHTGVAEARQLGAQGGQRSRRSRSHRPNGQCSLAGSNKISLDRVSAWIPGAVTGSEITWVDPSAYR